jgi:nicotinate-nucleotide adenylyltransferase
MAIGLFGGSFDPVHVGHLRVAEEVREHFKLDTIYFVPARVQPLKRLSAVSDASDRMRMIEMAIRDNDYFRLSKVETEREGVSYTIDTVKLFARRHKEICFLVGLDAFADIGLWKGYQELFLYANFILMVRPGRVMKELPESVRGQTHRVDDATWEHQSGNHIFLHQITQLDVSSTRIRGLLREGKSIKYLVPWTVERYVKKKGLYRE